MIAKIKINGDEIKIRQATRLGYITLPLSGGLADLSFPTSKLRRGRVQFNGQIAPTMTCGMTGLTVFEPIIKENKMAELLKKIADEVFERLRHTFRIRKLSPSECMVLMGMTREDVEKMKAMGVSNSQIYKIAGRQA